MSTSISDVTQAETEAVATDKKVVNVYVRKGSTDFDRWLTFLIPDSIAQGELLEWGCAIDGNQAVIAITPDTESPLFVTAFGKPGPGNLNDSSLPDVLRWVEVELAEFLDQHGCRAVFR